MGDLFGVEVTKVSPPDIETSPKAKGTDAEMIPKPFLQDPKMIQKSSKVTQ